MKTAVFPRPGAGPSADAPRDPLADPTTQEVEVLRAALETRLAALEAALANPDQCESIETVVLDLVRVATDEAEASARRAILDAQAAAHARVTAAHAETQASEASLETERAGAAALRAELEQGRAELDRVRAELKRTRAALDVDRSTGVALRRDLENAKAALEAERVAAAGHRRDVDEARAALGAESEVSTALRKMVDATEKRIAIVEEEKQAEVSSVQEQFAAVFAREQAATTQLTDALATLQHELAEVLTDATARIAEVETARARAAELEEQRGAAEQALKAAETRAKELEAQRREIQKALTNAETHATALETQRTDIQQALKAAETRAAALETQRTDVQQALRAAETRAAALETQGTDIQQALEAAETRATALQEQRTEIERALNDADTRADAVTRDREALTHELDSLRQTHAATAESLARLVALDTEQADLRRVCQETEGRLEVAARDRDAVAAELEGFKRAANEAQTEADARYEQLRETVEERIRALEIDLLQRDLQLQERDLDSSSSIVSSPEDADAGPVGLPDADTDPAGLHVGSPPFEVQPAPNQPLRRASRQVFHEDVEVQVDGGSAMLADLSIIGAQVLSPTVLKPNRVVTLQLPIEAGTLTCEGKIVWARLEPSADGSLRYRAGVSFTSVDEDAIEAFIARRKKKRRK